MNEHTLIANSGIQIITFPLSINTQERFKLWYHEWYDTENGEWRLDPVHELRTDDECYYYHKLKLHKGGYFSDPTIEIDVNDLKNDGISPLRIEDENCPGVRGEIFSMTFADRDNKLAMFENVWIPVPYFFKRTPKRFKFGPLNWARVKYVASGSKSVSLSNGNYRVAARVVCGVVTPYAGMANLEVGQYKVTYYIRTYRY